MHRVRLAGFVTYGIRMSAAPREEGRGPGRPRKWATEAERARAYRDRKAAEHADVKELRRERRILKQKLAAAARGRDRAEAVADRAAMRVADLEARVALVERDLD